MQFEQNLYHLIKKYGEDNGIELDEEKDFMLIKSGDEVKIDWFTDRIPKPTKQQLQASLPSIKQFVERRNRRKLLKYFKESEYYPIFKLIFQKLNITDEDLNKVI